MYDNIFNEFNRLRRYGRGDVFERRSFVTKELPCFFSLKELQFDIDRYVGRSLSDGKIYKKCKSNYKITHASKNYDLLYFSQNESEVDNEEKEANTKIINEIFKSDSKKSIDNKDSTIITLSPINDKVLKYLSENPQAFYQLTDTDFEIVMAEIYSKLGYNVELTKLTRDGGKDIILRKPEILGDFIYYVECKKYAPKRHIGIGLVRNLVGTITTDRVNGGILATTSYFTRGARKFILDNNYGYQIQMHDYDTIRRLLDSAIK